MALPFYFEKRYSGVIGLVLPKAKGKTVTVSVEGCDGTPDLTVE